ncbi:hypothetical protein C1645_833957 [Glomus cerebriforme]|uniref:Protein kinase domain-containing protein n=1 Tax=Glomus cerebriforme TaxID=658196 RepID=A0A397SGL5_9GLOM|nr:hypothetical protein C1645_833957 [Glomus cerebriforme]
MTEGGYGWKIGDLGLSQPANNTSSNNEIYGVIPYIAPEIFQEFAFSKESDIYDYVGTYNRTTKITKDTTKYFASLMKNCYESINVEFDIDFSSSSSNLNSTIQSSSVIWHPNENNTGSLNVLPTVVTSVKRRNIEESNIKTQ